MGRGWRQPLIVWASTSKFCLLYFLRHHLPSSSLLYIYALLSMSRAGPIHGGRQYTVVCMYVYFCFCWCTMCNDYILGLVIVGSWIQGKFLAHYEIFQARTIFIVLCSMKFIQYYCLYWASSTWNWTCLSYRVWLTKSKNGKLLYGVAMPIVWAVWCR